MYIYIYRPIHVCPRRGKTQKAAIMGPYLIFETGRQIPRPWKAKKSCNYDRQLQILD